MPIRPVALLLLILLFHGCAPITAPVDTVAKPHPATPTAETNAGLELKTASDAKKRFDEVAPNAKVDDRARAIADVEGWVFAADEEVAANQVIDAQIEALRGQIEKEVADRSKEAVQAPNGRIATEKLGQASRLLRLYPMPMGDAQQVKLTKIVTGIQGTSRRVEDIRRLRYNDWAIGRIEAGLGKYYEFKKILVTDQQALMDAVVDAVKEIDPSFLDPATLDLYNYLLGLNRDVLTEPNKINMAKSLSNPSTSRKTPLDF